MQNTPIKPTTTIKDLEKYYINFGRPKEYFKNKY